MSALPRKRTFGDAKHMSAKGQKRASLSIQSPRRRGAMSLGQRFFQLGHANMTADTSAKCHKRTFGRAALTQPPSALWPAAYFGRPVSLKEGGVISFRPF